MKNSVIRAAAHGAAALLVASSFVSLPAIAADAAMTPQQSRMATCSAQNKGKKGDDFKKSQSDCLKGTDSAAAAPMTQQQKMSMCSKQNKGKKGDDYKKAQSECLKG